MADERTLGEYIRRLRRGAARSLDSVAKETGLSYSHLSRVENDSTVPGPDTVAKLAEALGGDLKLMLEEADCLPRTILDRIVAREEAGDAASLRRTAGVSLAHSGGDDADAYLVELAVRHGIDALEAKTLASTIVEMLELSPIKRTAVAGLIKSLRRETDDEAER